MRFFRPALAPANFRPIQCRVNSSSILQLNFSPCLENLQIFCQPQVNKKVIQRSIQKKLDTVPFPSSINTDRNIIRIAGLKDILLELNQTTQTLKKEDPVFFQNLAYKLIQEEQGFGDTAESENSSDIFMLSSLRAKWFCLQGKRSEGLNHTVELALKLLQTEEHISQETLNMMLMPVWKRISEIREFKKIQTRDLQQTENIPYVFTNPR